MQRWWFLEDPDNARCRSEFRNPHESVVSESSAESYRERNWFFRVEVKNLLPGEIVYVTGNCNSLGNWMPNKAPYLKREGNTDIWSRCITIPLKEDVYFRFAVMVPDATDNERIYVRRWETNITPRIIMKNVEQSMDEVELLTFAFYNDEFKEGPGWLTTDCAVQFKLFNNPIHLKGKLQSRTVHVKITPVNLRLGVEGQTMLSALEESLSGDTHDIVDQPANIINQVATMNNHQYQLDTQEQFGRAYNKDDFTLFHMVMPRMENVAYLVDVFTYASKAQSGEPPQHLAYHYILPCALSESIGMLSVPLNCAIKHRPIGMLTLEYLKIQPLLTYQCNMSVSYAQHWSKSWTGLDVGHRGLGTSFKNKDGNNIRENTIASLKKAAAHGADMVEFDVQLSKDLVPIIYHDYHVAISMKNKQHLEYQDMMELSVKDLTLEQLHKLKIYHLVEGRENCARFCDENLEEHQPFPTVEEVLHAIDSHIGFNIEVKWTMKLRDGSYELNNPVDMNVYVDKILEVVLTHGGSRRIVFSSFHPDICTMIRMKQNMYPVMFLTQGVTEKYPSYHDARCISIHKAVQHAVCQSLLGIVVHTEDLLRDSSQVSLATDAGLVIFCWGDDNNNQDTIRHLKDLGIHAVIYDKLDQYVKKDVLESIFLIESKESASKELLAMTRLESEPLQIEDKKPIIPRMLDLTEAREMLDNVSTATSLVSIMSTKQKH